MRDAVGRRFRYQDVWSFFPTVGYRITYNFKRCHATDVEYDKIPFLGQHLHKAARSHESTAYTSSLRARGAVVSFAEKLALFKSGWSVEIDCSSSQSGSSTGRCRAIGS